MPHSTQELRTKCSSCGFWIGDDGEPTKKSQDQGSKNHTRIGICRPCGYKVWPTIFGKAA